MFQRRMRQHVSPALLNIKTDNKTISQIYFTVVREPHGAGGERAKQAREPRCAGGEREQHLRLADRTLLR